MEDCGIVIDGQYRGTFLVPVPVPSKKSTDGIGTGTKKVLG